jgi:hypothetical protein
VATAVGQHQSNVATVCGAPIGPEIVGVWRRALNLGGRSTSALSCKFLAQRPDGKCPAIIGAFSVYGDRRFLPRLVVFRAAVGSFVLTVGYVLVASFPRI